jgi:hypothetical protein
VSPASCGGAPGNARVPRKLARLYTSV